jgi:hypothetical protein
MYELSRFQDFDVNETDQLGRRSREDREWQRRQSKVGREK